MSEMRRVFSISEDSETQLWDIYGGNSRELLTNLEMTVQDAGLYQGQV